jgi:hypothetical protein
MADSQGPTDGLDLIVSSTSSMQDDEENVLSCSQASTSSQASEGSSTTNSSEVVQDRYEQENKKLKSIVHDHFESVKVGAKFLHRCNHCGAKLSSSTKSNTSNRLHHMRSRHPTLLPRVTTISTSPEDDRAVLTRWIVTTDQPFSIVEGLDYRHLTHNNLPTTRKTVKQDVLKTFAAKRQNLVAIMKRVDSKIAITCDAWTSTNYYSFFAIGAHWIDSNWEAQNVLLDFRPLDGPHTGENLAAELAQVFEDFGITKKVVAIVCDSAANNDKMIRLLRAETGNDFDHIRCLAHVIHIMYTHGMKALKATEEESLIGQLRKFINAVRSSPQRRQR